MSELEPGRELDALVAEHVMGFRPAAGWFKTTGPPVLPQPYSTDIAAGFEVMEKLIDSGACGVRLACEPGLKWSVCCGQYNVVEDTAPHAICLAALKAVGYKA